MLKLRRETLKQAIKRFNTCRCGTPFDSKSIGWRHKRLPVLIPMCKRCADHNNRSIPDDWVIVKLRKAA